MPKKESNDQSRQALDSVRNAFRNVGDMWRGCKGRTSLTDGFRRAACAFDAVADQFIDLGGKPLAVGRYRRIAANLATAADLFDIALSDQAAVVADRAFTAGPVRRLALDFQSLARSANAVESKQTQDFKVALLPLSEVAAEFTFMAELITRTDPEVSLAQYRPYLEASAANIGRLLINCAVLIPIVAFFSVCPDICTPCGTATVAFAFSGRFQVVPVEGGARRVDPIFTATGCCSESCLLIFSRCNTVSIDKVVPAPDNIAIVSPRDVGQAQGQIRARIRGGQLAAPAFAATDCP